MRAPVLPNEGAGALFDALALANLGSQPTDRIVFHIYDSFLHRNNCIVSDTDMFWTDLSAALGDVAHS